MWTTYLYANLYSILLNRHSFCNLRLLLATHFDTGNSIYLLFSLIIVKLSSQESMQNNVEMLLLQTKFSATSETHFKLGEDSSILSVYRPSFLFHVLL